MSPEERAQFVADVAEAINNTIPSPLSLDEAQWVRMAIRKEAQSIAFRQAVIEKTTGALLVAAVLAVSGFIYSVLREYGIAHGWKP